MQLFLFKSLLDHLKLAQVALPLGLGLTTQKYPSTSETFNTYKILK